MSGKQTRRLLVVAFALSLLVHLVAVVFVRWPRPRADDMVAVVHVIRIRPLRIAHVATPPPPTPDIPAAARGAAVSGTARVRVTVDPNGTIAAASLAQSSGDSGLDLAALAMARSASYAPATHACKPVAAEYVYAVKFVAW